ncbi:MAG UNVERIFIED_CONTAM: NACHT domain-containing protein [Rickettsiaceae bacterium]|jgi:hypothetical protein
MTTASFKEQLKAHFRDDSKLPRLIEDIEDIEVKGKGHTSKNSEIPEHDLKDYYVTLQTIVRGEEKRPIKLTDIFNAIDGEAHEVHKVLVVGGPGVGKSTLMHYLSWKWGEGDLWNNKFDYVFRIRLKNFSDDHWKHSYAGPEIRKHPLACFIMHNLPDHMQNSFGLQDVIDVIEHPSNKDRIAFLLDGYDEVDGLVSKKGIPKNVFNKIFEYPNVVMSTRTNALTSNVAAIFERTIENIGLDDKAVSQYIGKYFVKNEALGKDLLIFLENNKEVAETCKIPINILMMCLVWGDSQVQSKA